MDAGETGTTRAMRIAVAASVGAICALGAWLLLSSSPAAAGGEPGPALLPDLIVEPPNDIILQRPAGSKTTYLRFDHTTSNVGLGPLEVYPDLSTDTCGEKGDRGRVAYQAIFLDSTSNGGPDGVFKRGQDTEWIEDPVGCMIFHEIHNHYHFQEFAEYELYRVESGLLKETSDKVSFCVFDLTRTHPELPGSPNEAFYGFQNCDRDDGTHGISVGYADIYGSNTPGQEFDVTGRRKGRYCLVAKTDPADRLEEVALGGDDNNVQTVQIKLDRRKASEFGEPVKILSEPCSPPTTP